MPKGQMRKAEASRFAMVPRNDVPRSAFDVVHMHKTTFNSGDLVPVYIDEVLPGDSFRLKMAAFCRTATALVPIMDNLIFETFFFFVPNRLCWSNWERFMGEQTSPTDTTVFLMPYVIVDAVSIGQLGDYFGITVQGGAAKSLQINALPFRAYAMIWNDWFRDEDIDTMATVAVDDGPDTWATVNVLRQRRKRHDYFTSARPWPQKPINAQDLSTSIMGPLAPGGRMTFPQAGAPVSGLGINDGAAPTVGANSVRMAGTRVEVFDPFYNSTDDPFYMKVGAGNAPDVRVLINDIRTANMVQLLLERNSRGGTRYSELVRSHFGVVSPDARLQRPEYLGGGRTYIAVNAVAQTSASGVAGTTTVLGEQAGIGTAGAYNHGFSQSFTEHGMIIGLVSVRGDLSYQQGVERMWLRRTQFDFYWPALAHLGEQAIMRTEIYALGEATDQTVFGYQERWSEYKYKPSRISGEFRSTGTTPIDMWHLAQKFTAAPTLNSSFMAEAPPVTRVLQVATGGGHEFLLDTMFEVRKVRPMPMFSIPGIGPRL